MGKVYPEIDDRLAEWIRGQHIFFVATVALAEDGLVNCSPKGLDTFAILDPHTVAYLDLTGSGIQTVAHLRENGRIVIMFCALEGPPKILRLHGRGTVLEPGDPDFESLRGHFPPYAGVRAIIRVDVTRIADSCGTGVPLYAYQGQREALVRFGEQLGEEGVRAYQRRYNHESLEGLPGLRSAR